VDRSTVAGPGVPDPGGMASPVERLPPPAAPGVRREVSLVLAPRQEWTAGSAVRGRAREVLRRPGGSDTTTARASLVAQTDGAGSLLSLDLPGHPDVARELCGRGIRGGFRAALAATGLDLGAPDAALLDDLPATQLISGYALMMEGLLPSAPRPGRDGGRDGGDPPLLGICSGWRPDGAAVQRTRAQVRLLGEARPVPDFSSLTGGSFLEEEQLQPRTMRRRRLLEAVPDAGGWAVSAYLRDSHVAADGVERGLHEYVVTARVDGPDLLLRDVVAEPRTLPFRDCPLAAPQVNRLTGMPAADAGRAVVDRLPGTAGCTHLNDLLRTFRALPRLTALLSAEPPEAATHRGDRS
jgi:DUF2889 family protein